MTTPQPIHSPPSQEPPAAAPAPPERAPRRRFLGTALKISFAAAGLLAAGLVASKVGWSELGERLANAAPLPLAAATALLATRFFAWQQRWGIAAAAVDGPTRFRLRQPALLASVLANHATPWLRILGGIFRARYLSRTGERTFARHYGAVLFDQIAHHLVQVAATWGASVALAWRLGFEPLATAGGAVGGLLLLALLRLDRSQEADWAERMARRTARLAGDRGRRFRILARQGHEVALTLGQLLANRGLWLRVLPWSGLFVVSNVGAVWVLFRAVGSSVGIVDAAVVVGLGAFAGVAVGSPGGVGTTEAAMIAGFVALGVDRVDAVAATVLYRGLHYALVVGLGGPALAWMELGRPARAAQRSAPPATS